MRKSMLATALSAVLVAGLGATSVAHAQSVLQTIEALKPRPGKSRGSRPAVAPPSDLSGSSAAPSAPAASAAPAPRHSVATAAPARHAPVPAAEADAPAIDFNILFATGSADLQPAALTTLDTLGKALSSAELSGSRFRIEGHTDTVGTREENKALSARRAAAVVDYLTHKFSIDPSRLESVGLGEEALRIPTADQVSEPRNRRVRVINITG